MQYWVFYFVQADNINIMILQSYERDNTFLIHTPLFISKPRFIAFLFSLHRFLLNIIIFIFLIPWFPQTVKALSLYYLGYSGLHKPKA